MSKTASNTTSVAAAPTGRTGRGAASRRVPGREGWEKKKEAPVEEASSSPSEPLGALPLSGGAADTLNLLARDARGRGRVWAPLALDSQTLCSHCCEPDV